MTSFLRIICGFVLGCLNFIMGDACYEYRESDRVHECRTLCMEPGLVLQPNECDASSDTEDDFYEDSHCHMD